MYCFIFKLSTSIEMKDRLILVQIFHAYNRSSAETMRKFCLDKGYKTKAKAPTIAALINFIDKFETTYSMKLVFYNQQYTRYCILTCKCGAKSKCYTNYLLRTIKNEFNCVKSCCMITHQAVLKGFTR